jgi:hypothetical protein
MLLVLSPISVIAQRCSIGPDNYKGWHAQRLANQWVTLEIVPQLGGRLMQVSFGPHSYLFVNPVYEGKYFPPSQAAGKWFNYGGDKIWPLPEGSAENEWPGGSDVLDDSEYSARVTSTGEICTLHLDGPPDARTGLQYHRDISIDGQSPRIRFHAVMTNASAHAIEWSVQSVSQYDTADASHPGTYNQNFWAFTPVNAASAYLNGYHIRSGVAEHPSFAVRGALFTLHWTYLQSEVWLDSPGDWVAVVDGQSSFAMVERSRVQPKATYPGKATVIFYIDGPALRMDPSGNARLTSADPRETPYYMEAELNSPMVQLQPGEFYGFDTEWFPTRATAALQQVTDAGVVMTPLSATRSGAGLMVTGEFGVFSAGHLIARLYDQHGQIIANERVSAASPLEVARINATVPAPQNAASVGLHLEDSQQRDLGSLGECRVAGVTVSQ